MHKAYVDICATIDRCEEEKRILLRETRDGVAYYEREVQQLNSALGRLGSGVCANGQQRLLRRDLVRAERQRGRMLASFNHIQALFGVIDINGEPVSPPPAPADIAGEDADSGIGASDEFPELDNDITREESSDEEDEAAIDGEYDGEG